MAKGSAAKLQKESAVLYRAVRFEIKPDSSQLDLLLRVSENLREVWNRALDERVDAYHHYKEQQKEGVQDLQKIPSLFDQINALTALRAESQSFCSVPRNWQEEALDTLNGSFSSFFALAKKGDPDARSPWKRQEGRFAEISGRSGFSVKNGSILFAPTVFGKDVLSFPIPSYQQGRLAE